MKLLTASTIILFSILLCWQSLIFLTQLPSYILPSPLEMLIAFDQQKYLILHHLIPTMIEIVVGFILGIFFGVLAAIIIAFYRSLAFWFLPVLIISQAIPTFAIAPLLVLWFGYGLSSKIATTVLMIFFPIVSCFYDGLKQKQTPWLDLAKTMQAKKWRTFWYIRIPAALPHLASGIRIAATIAPIGAIIGEWVGSSQGLGYLMLNANARLQIDVMFAVLMVIVVLSLALYFIVDRLLRTLVWWE